MTVLLVMAKSPVAGLVKTRLCPPATPTEAARIAAAALLDTMAAVRDTAGVEPVLALAGRFADADVTAGTAAELTAATAGWRVLVQRGSGLADRLANAHADVADAWPGRQVLQIGMDTPQLTPARLASAVDRLTEAGAVLGPAADGGWWALGLRDPRDADALRAVPMSTARTGRRTWLALVGRGLAPVRLPVLRDVDEWPDAVAVARGVPGSRFARQVAAVRRCRPAMSAEADR
ncbi:MULTISPECIES: TIGR04282 family arsenosugar biosynthesis glycosyltransferase [unclassified Solwaraspora]|uniref:TIGR04282 family arsenosugar biosynthesis glycosyltransferase n=1 Tax=unclassified Solwaraspora TaxID=2627926 RepID=UPI00259BC934|nr:DUF2064 domain-containing protein [Solwaraspora sp. WMMA2056]WJK41817.1 DUF2064 domain-containing protein [Solwaraspora sp. WMMA2056]